MSTSTHRPRVALVTCAAHPQLYEDEGALLPSLVAAGAAASAVVWNDPSVEWNRFDLVALRSTWDYFERYDEFLRWLDRIERARVPLCNPVSLVRWNLDKRYLVELEHKGAAIVPTCWVERGERLDLAAHVRAAGWSEAILKPAVSGGAYRTHRFAAADAATLQAELDSIVATGGALVQPFLPEIETEGEWSLVFFAGELSHVVLKTPKANDFRVQPQFGGRFRSLAAPPTMLAAAAKIVRLLPSAPLYVRIDGVRRGDQFLLMEVEAIEPYLYLGQSPGAAERYVRALLNAIELERSATG
jgi:hypothetical protein